VRDLQSRDFITGREAWEKNHPLSITKGGTGLVDCTRPLTHRPCAKEERRGQVFACPRIWIY
jgi:hypothetical protein